MISVKIPNITLANILAFIFAFLLRSFCVPFAFLLRSICVPFTHHLRSFYVFLGYLVHSYFVPKSLKLENKFIIELHYTNHNLASHSHSSDSSFFFFFFEHTQISFWGANSLIFLHDLWEGEGVLNFFEFSTVIHSTDSNSCS